MRKLVFIYLLLLPLVAAFGQGSKSMYTEGERFFAQKNYAEAAKCYEKAVKAGDDMLAPERLITCYEEMKDYKKAAKWAKRATDDGSPTAAMKLCEYYMYGMGVKHDPEKAIEIYRKWIDETEYPRAMVGLGICYQEGIGVEQSDSDAYYWFRNAARLGDAEGQYLTAYYCFQGKGTLQDYKAASEWAQKAAAQGNAEAAELLRKIPKE